MYVISSMSEICVKEVKYRKKDMEKNVVDKNTLINFSWKWNVCGLLNCSDS